jgi:hypothetical protein
MSPIPPSTARPPARATDRDPPSRSLVAFDGERLLASGSLDDVSRAVRQAQVGGAHGAILVFDAVTSEPVEVDPREPSSAPAGGARPAAEPLGAAADETSSDAGEAPRGPGRPRLGVVPREVTLLPRHWEWLSTQPGGASAALRRLVDQARNAGAERDRRRAAQESAYRFMAATLGNQPHFEEAIRALFAADRARFLGLSEAWPRDLRDHARHLTAAAFAPPSHAPSP